MSDNLFFTGSVVSDALEFTGDGTSTQILVTGSVATKGDVGATGPPNTLSIGTVTTGTAGATITGSAPSQSLNLVLPLPSDATIAVKGIMQLTGDLGGTATSPKVKRTASFTVAPFGSTLAADYICSTATGNELELNPAIVATSALPNGGVLYLKAGTYTMITPLVPKSKVRIVGEGPGTILKILADSDVFVNDSNALDSFELENLTFIGNNTSGQAKGAIFLDGDLHTVGAPQISNITMRNCVVKNTRSLPIRLFGIRGKVMVTGCEFNHCLDAGFIFDEEVIFIGNHSIDSGDNGFSISRGCLKVTCVGNTSENATLFGMWFGGFLGDAGPSNLAITGNTVKNCRRSGIYLGGSPQNAVVSGNMIDMNHNRATDSDIDGIQVYGDNTTTQFANNISVNGNTILNASRAGVTVNNAKNVSITGNLIVNPGTQYLADGTTVIASSDVTTNIGIFSSHLTNTNVWVDGNSIIDDRATPYCNWDIYKIQSPSSGITQGQNYSVGMRNTRNRLDLIDLPQESGNDVALNFNGPDADISANVNMQGNGQLRVRGTGNQFNINNTSVSSSARTSVIMSAGATTASAGLLSVTRTHATASSIMALRPLSNSAIMGADNTAALYYQGSDTTSKGFLGWNGGLVASRKTVSNANYTILTQDYIVAYITTLTVGRTVTLPTSPTTGQTHIIADETGLAATWNLTIAPGSGTIDGAANLVMNVNYGAVQVYYNGTNWKVQGGVYNASQFPILNQDTTGKSAKTDALNSATTVINVSSSTAPSIGQVLTATDSTHATWQAAAGGAPTGTAGGDLSGTYPNPAVAAIHVAAASTIADAIDIGLGTTTGTKIGTSTSQKLGFFNATPVVQQTASTDLGTSLANLGLRASGATYTLSTSGTSAFTGAHSLTGSQRALGVARTGAVTLTSSSSTNNECDATSAAFTITLPTVTGNAGVIFEFIKVDSSGNAVTVGTTSSQTINGSTTYSLATQYKYVKVRANAGATAWLVVGNN